jgi:hypothetical protein
MKNPTTIKLTESRLARLVRNLSAWAWRHETFANGEVHILYYEHTTRTYGGDLKAKGILSTWTCHADAERAESDAWTDVMHLNWDRKSTKIWIEKESVQIFAN